MSRELSLHRWSSAGVTWLVLMVRDVQSSEGPAAGRAGSRRIPDPSHTHRLMEAFWFMSTEQVLLDPKGRDKDRTVVDPGTPRYSEIEVESSQVRVLLCIMTIPAHFKELKGFRMPSM